MIEIKLFHFVLLLSSLGLGQVAFADGLNAYLGSENAQIGICGNLPIERKRRDCLKATDLKQCLEQDRINPRYLMTSPQEKDYICINTSSTTGSQIIEEMVLSSQDACLTENINSFYREIIDNPEFHSISRQFEESLGIPLRLNYAIDTLNSVSSIQLDLKDYKSPLRREEDITLNVSPFSQKSPCLKISSKSILKKVSQELARLTIKAGATQNNKIGQNPKKSKRVFDASRFQVPQNDQSSAQEMEIRQMASER